MVLRVLVRTLHIQGLLDEAKALAFECDGQELYVGIEEPMVDSDPKSLKLRKLERAVNLARHAAAELEDELLRARDGWPVI